MRTRRPNDALSDDDLVAVYRAGPALPEGAQALAALLDRHKVVIDFLTTIYAAKLLPDGHDTKAFQADILGHFHAKVLQRLRSDKEIRSVEALLRTIIKTSALDARRFYVNNRLERLDESIHEPSDSASATDEAAMEPEGKERIVQEALNRLAASSEEGLKMAIALRLSYRENKTHQEIAQHLKIQGLVSRDRCEKTIQRLLKKAEEELRDILKRDFGVTTLEDV
jgi:DNA-directed RNA polymerase specialized sigma24 family protein